MCALSVCVYTNSTAWGRARRRRNVDWLILFCTHNQRPKKKKKKKKKRREKNKQTKGRKGDDDTEDDEGVRQLLRHILFQQIR